MAFDKRKLRREIEQERKAQLRARLKVIGEEVKTLRAKRWEAIRAVQLDCRLKRVQLRDSCRARKVDASDRGRQAVQEAQETARTTRRTETQLDRAGKRPGLRSTARERGQESDDEVRSNLEPTMVRVFDKVRKHIKGSPRKSRTEAFFQWAEENPGEVYDLLQHDADRYLAQLLAEQARTEREIRRASTAGVPF
jgi:predicted kinase